MINLYKSFFLALLSAFLIPSALSFAAEIPQLGKKGISSFQLGPVHYLEEVGIFEQRPVAYVLRRGQLETAFKFQTVNDSLDLFNAKHGLDEDSNVEDLDFSGRVGDYAGKQVSFNFGLTNDISLLSQIQQIDLEYGISTITIDQLTIGGRYQIVKEDDLPQISMEFKFHHMRGSGFEKEFSQIHLEDVSGLLQNDNVEIDSLTLNLESPEKMKFGGLKTEQWQLRAILSKRLTEGWYGHLLIGHERAHISSEVRFSLPGFEPFEEFNTRDQQALRFGAGVDWKIAERWLLDVFVEGTRKVDRVPRVPEDDRSTDRRAPEDNRVARTDLFYYYSPDLIFSVSAHYYHQFFTGEIPFLLNDKTFEVFDKPYGYVGLGVLYKVDYGAISSYPFFVAPSSEKR